MRNFVQLCLVANDILLMRKWNHAFLLLAMALVWKWQLPTDIYQKTNSVTEWIRQIVIIIYYYWSARQWQNTIFCSTSSNRSKIFTKRKVHMSVLTQVMFDPWGQHPVPLGLRVMSFLESLYQTIEQMIRASNLSRTWKTKHQKITFMLHNLNSFAI